jgi:hypothetical protein
VLKLVIDRKELQIAFEILNAASTSTRWIYADLVQGDAQFAVSLPAFLKDRPAPEKHQANVPTQFSL